MFCILLLTPGPAVCVDGLLNLTITCFLYFLPLVADLSQLHPKMVQLLALQRISQLLTDPVQARGSGQSVGIDWSETHSGSHSHVKDDGDQVNGCKKLSHQAIGIPPTPAPSNFPPPSKGRWG